MGDSLSKFKFGRNMEIPKLENVEKKELKLPQTCKRSNDGQSSRIVIIFQFMYRTNLYSLHTNTFVTLIEKNGFIKEYRQNIYTSRYQISILNNITVILSIY
jgi:hypothetical protein